MPGEYNITVRKNSDFRLNFTLRDDAQNAIDNTGWTGRMQVRAQERSTSVIIDLSSSDNEILFGGTDGTVNIILTADKLIELPQYENAYYDVVLRKSSDEVFVLLKGNFTILPGITLNLPPALSP